MNPRKSEINVIETCECIVSLVIILSLNIIRVKYQYLNAKQFSYTDYLAFVTKKCQ